MRNKIHKYVWSDKINVKCMKIYWDVGIATAANSIQKMEVLCVHAEKELCHIYFGNTKKMWRETAWVGLTMKHQQKYDQRFSPTIIPTRGENNEKNNQWRKWGKWWTLPRRYHSPPVRKNVIHSEESAMVTKLDHTSDHESGVFTAIPCRLGGGGTFSAVRGENPSEKKGVTSVGVLLAGFVKVYCWDFFCLVYEISKDFSGLLFWIFSFAAIVFITAFMKSRKPLVKFTSSTGVKKDSATHLHCAQQTASPPPVLLPANFFWYSVLFTTFFRPGGASQIKTDHRLLVKRMSPRAGKMLWIDWIGKKNLGKIGGTKLCSFKSSQIKIVQFINNQYVLKPEIENMQNWEAWEYAKTNGGWSMFADGNHFPWKSGGASPELAVIRQNGSITRG